MFSPRRVLVPAALLALLGPVTATYRWLDSGSPKAQLEWELVFLCLLPVLASGLVGIGRFETAVLARGLLWSLLCWIALATVFGGMDEPHIVIWGLGLGGALVVLQAQPLDRLPGTGAHGRAPVRGPLQAVLTMSIADTVALFFWGVVGPGGPHRPASWALLGAGFLMAVVVAGLARLRTWAFVLNVLANIGIAVMAWCLDDLPNGFAAALTATAVLQLLAGVPVSLALLRGRAHAVSPWVGRAIVGATVTVLVGVMVVRVALA